MVTSVVVELAGTVGLTGTTGTVAVVVTTDEEALLELEVAEPWEEAGTEDLLIIADGVAVVATLLELWDDDGVTVVTVDEAVWLQPPLQEVTTMVEVVRVVITVLLWVLVIGQTVVVV